MPLPRKDRFSSAVNRLVLAVALFVALILPLGYSSLAYRNLVFHVETIAQVKADGVTSLVSGNPALWVYQVQRIETVLASAPAPTGDEAVSAYDANGALLVHVGSPPAPPLLHRAYALHDSGRVVGRVEVEHTLRGLIYGSVFAALLGALLAGALYGVFVIWPLRALRRLNVALHAEQAALRESEERFRTLIEWTPKAIGVHRDGKLIYVNPAAIRMLGASSAEQLIGKPILERVHPDFHQLVRARARRMAEEGIDEPQIEEKFLKLDGTVIDVEVQGTSILYDGEPAVHIAVRDITERKRVEAALQESEERFRSVWEVSADGMRLCDGSGRIVSVNNAYCFMVGKTVEELNGQFFSEAYSKDENARILRRFIENVAAHTIDASFEKELTLWKGNKRWFAVTNTLLDSLGGRVLVLSTFRDITERKRAEVEVRTLSRAMEQSPASVVITNRAGMIDYVNPRFEQVSGYTRAEVAGRNPRILNSGKNPPEIYQQLWAAITEGGEWSGELCNRRKNGELFWEFAAISGVRGDSGEIEHYIAVKEDITERKAAEAARTLLEGQLRESQKMQAIGTLAGGIAHDFNNILATILGNAELARQDVSTHPLALESLEEIRKAGSRARDLVQQILSFSRRQPTERKPTALILIVEEAARLLRATLPARLTLEVNCDAAVPPVLADATQIEQVIINLVTNAMQAIYGRPGRIGIRLDTVMLDAAWVTAHPALHALHGKHPGCTVRLAVRDDGPGMDAATLGRIFEPFFTTREVDEGTGLGLSVVHGIVQTHEGEIEVVSQPGKGATFTIYLPVAEAQHRAAATGGIVNAVPPASTPRAGGGQHILYLDDDESLVFLIRRLLERRGFRISGYTDQREALEALSADAASFDLVVTDYNMPGMSGLDVAREVRLIRADLPVAVASGFIDEALRAQAGAAGVRELIFKANEVDGLCDIFARLAQSVGINH